MYPLERPAASVRTPRVVSAVKLLRSAGRRKAGEFLVEGANAVEAALEAGVVRELFYVADAGMRVVELVAQAEASGVLVTLVDDRAAKALGDTVTPPGLVGVATLIDVPLDRALVGSPRLLAVPVEVTEPGNAGAIIRVADAVGADAVVLAGESVDPHNGKCVRASAGSVFHLPIARERAVPAVLDALGAAGIQLLATAADGEIGLDDADDVLARPTAWLFGNEAHGLPSDVLARADHRIRIPIHGRAESLNLATAAAICLYESSRVQRRAGNHVEPIE
ncbi:RNA methyltransferase [Antrihabitans sp. YC2-6]|uniref:TrmH family RNA methyltransferase n=1 Tax=Antrihabitans sp. YC2-6 TaxID=2799498 RepID=UPI0018F5AD10|nr:RNA methyltransferase [Antrihabitans sp. YC2-6]MBJ8343058.1 RNA methyltransferase [Antrihabitans sp. YC2-6]